MTADRCDLLVRGARVIDPAQALDAVADVAVAGGRIAGVGDMPVPRAARVIDGGGLVASPGWIDLHVHCVEGPGVGAVHPDRDAGIDAGVTTVVDTGSVGVDRLDELLDVARSARTRVLGFLNVSATRTAPVHGDWQAFDQARTIAAAERHRDRVVGIKVLASQRHCGNLGLVPGRPHDSPRVAGGRGVGRREPR